MSWLKRSARRRSAQGAKRVRRGEWFEICEDRTLLATFTVVNNANDGDGSLRQAIIDANEASGDDEIEFAEGLGVIGVTSELPAVVGKTSFNAPLVAGVVIDGGGGAYDGLILGPGSDGSSIQGLTIRNFGKALIHVQSDGDLVAGNVLGGGNQVGVFIDGGSGNTIGVGDSIGSGNTIGSSTTAGIQILGASATGNVVDGNAIGGDGSSATFGNAFGVQIVNSSGNTIGGEAGNTIGYNTTAGIIVLSGEKNVVTRNHYIGTNGTGNPASVSDINIGSTANNGQVAPMITTASLDSGQLTLTFGTILGAGTVVEIYTMAPGGDRVFTGASAIPSGGGSSVTLPSGLSAGDDVLVTVTAPANGSSAFSGLAEIVAVADPFTVTTTASSGPGSLFQVLTNANLEPGATPIDIKFAGALTIPVSASSPLPAITHPVVLNSNDQSGVVIDGGQSAALGFLLGAGSGGSTIQNLTIRGFVQAGISLLSDGNTIVGNTIGAPGSGNLVGVLVASSGNTIGGEGGANTIGSNASAGVSILSGSSNVVSRNLYLATNGPGDPPSVSDINLSPTANNGQPRPEILTASLNDAGNQLTLTFPSELPAGTVLELYKLGDGGRREFVVSQTLAAAAKGVTISTSAVSKADTILVTATSKDGDSSAFSNQASIADPFTVTTAESSGPGSLFQVLTNANNAAGVDAVEISFSGAFRIVVPAGSPLPPITHPIVLNSNNQSGVVIDGAGTAFDGLVLGLGSGGSTIQNLTIQGFVQAGIHILSSGNKVVDSVIGTPSGGANAIGVFIDGGSSNTIGGSTAGANTIGFNTTAGVQIQGASASGNVVAGNWIGTDKDKAARPNGVGVLIVGSSGNTIGGSNAAAANTIGDNTAAGVSVAAGVQNIVSRNLFTNTNGPLTPAAANDITLSSAGNNGQPAPNLLSASLGDENLLLQFAAVLPAGTVVEVYDLGSSNERRFLATVTLDADAASVSVPVSDFVFPVKVEDAQLLATTAPPDDGTSPFSNVAAAVGPNVVVNTNPEGEGSLRAAIIYANTNALASPVTILFHIPSTDIGYANGNWTIYLDADHMGALPEIHSKVYIDGLSQYLFINDLETRPAAAPAPLVWISGARLVGASDGLDFINGSGGSTVDDLGFIQFTQGAAIHADFRGAESGVARDVTIINCTIVGAYPTTDAGGVKVASTDPAGVGVLLDESVGSRIGNAYIDTSTGAVQVVHQSNLIVYTDAGIKIRGGSGNIVQANFIGSSGEQNTYFNRTGIAIIGSDSNQIGGANLLNEAGQLGFLVAGNLIGNNKQAGISISDLAADPDREVEGKTSTGNSVLGNYIGVNPDNPTKLRPGNGIGVLVDASSNSIGGDADGVQTPETVGGIKILESYANVIGNNTVVGVWLRSGADENLVTGNYVGTDRANNPLGNTAADVSDYPDLQQEGLGGSGILVSGGGNRIGRTTESSNNGYNVIGYNVYGVALLNTNTSALWNLVQGNDIGVSEFGDPVGNTTAGVILKNSSFNVVGTVFSDGHPELSCPLAANRIASNLGDGVQLAGASSNIVSGNIIGAGQAGGGNHGDGVHIEGGSGNIIGGGLDGTVGGLLANQALPAAFANQIVGNGGNGVLIEPDGSGEEGSKSPNLVQWNQISRNVLNGVKVTGDLGGTATFAIIHDNVIGTDFGGKLASDPTDSAGGDPTGNGLSGILLESDGSDAQASASGAGGNSVVVAGNLVSSNGLSGVTVGWLGGVRLARVVVAGNMLGLDITGEKAKSDDQRPFGNALDGVRIDGVVGVQLVALSLPARLGAPQSRPNVISGNLGRGVEVVGAGLIPGGAAWRDEANTIDSNYIGTDATGQTIQASDGSTLGNLSDGVFLLDPANTTISSNVIGGNRAAGVHATKLSAGAGGTISISRNSIGTREVGDGAGAQELDLNNGSDGVFLDRVDSATIDGNRISQNRANGINILDSGTANTGSASTAAGSASTGIRIIGNHIGTGAAAFKTEGGEVKFKGNYGNGVFLNNAHDVTIGGDSAGAGNTISGNQASGVLISLGSHNNISGNRIGVSDDGMSAVPNNNSGVIISLSTCNSVGGAAEGQGNIISGNQLYGVMIAGGAAASTSSNIIQGNRIGVDVDGKNAVPNTADGVFVLNADTNQIGGEGAARNVISGNSAEGVRIFGKSSFYNSVVGNLIGVDATGSKAVGNGGDGVILDDAGQNAVGPDNVISGNKQSGVMISSPSNASPRSIIRGNKIGLDWGGKTALGNGASGILVFGSSDNAIISNIISGNALDGVQIFSPGDSAPANGNYLAGNLIGADATGKSAVGNLGDGVHIINGSSNIVGGAADGLFNVISGNSNGVTIDQQANRLAQGNILNGNLIGTDVTGLAPLNNRHFGVLLNNATGNRIGMAGQGSIPGRTTAPGVPSNVISWNLQAGVGLTGTAGMAYDGREWAPAPNVVQGNFIGAGFTGYGYDLSGQGSPSPANQVGVLIDASASYNVIGGSTPGTGNIITQSGARPASPSAQDPHYIGVEINSITALANVLQGNLIGLDVKNQVGANSVGVLLNNSKNTVIGGATPAEGNVISGNVQAGVLVNGQFSDGNGIYSNYIGTKSTGESLIPKPEKGQLVVPPQESGVLISQGVNTRVGAVGAGNVISGNLIGVNIAGHGVGESDAARNVVQGNRIGVDPTGMLAVPNAEFGVFITASANNVIDANQISANGLAGVEIFGGTSQLATNAGTGTAAGLGTVITRNSIGVDADGQVVFALYNGSQFITPPLYPTDVVLPDGMAVTYGFQQHGVVVIGASNNYVGLPGQGNLISGNIQTGVYITQRDEKLRLYATPTNNVVQANSIVLDGIYGVFRYDAPYGNPVLEAPAANANTFTGTPIPLGDYVTGFNQQTPGSQQAKSLLIYGPAAVAGQTGSAGAGAPKRPGALRRKTTPGGKIPGRARVPVATANPASPHPRALQRAALARRLAGRAQAAGSS